MLRRVSWVDSRRESSADCNTLEVARSESAISEASINVVVAFCPKVSPCMIESTTPYLIACERRSLTFIVPPHEAMRSNSMSEPIVTSISSDDFIGLWCIYSYLTTPPEYLSIL